MFDDLTDKNIELYMMKYYENPQCLDLEEYNDDIKRIKYIKRLFNRYENTGDLKERLILNHIVVLYNVYDIEVATRILFFKIDPSLWSVLKTFLVFLGCMPERVLGIKGETILDSDIPVNFDIANHLREI
jgi:hypothetical protein